MYTWQGPFEEVFEGTKAHYLPLITCLNYLLARQQRGAHGKVLPGLNAAQRGQLLLAMRLHQVGSTGTPSSAFHHAPEAPPSSAFHLAPEAPAAPAFHPPSV